MTAAQLIAELSHLAPETEVYVVSGGLGDPRDTERVYLHEGCALIVIGPSDEPDELRC